MPPEGADIPCSDILKVLANDVRLKVVQQLLSGPKTVGEINSDLKLEKSLLSHHLKQLRSHGIVKTQREGKSIRYQLSPGVAVRHKGDGLNLGCCELVFLESKVQS
jgi:DNA-binding transcriptional ArsR family regulator